MGSLIECEDVWKIYRVGDVEVQALRGLSLTIEQGEFVAIMGSSGSGKSTLMNILGCLDQPTKGRYRLNGIEVGNLKPDQLAGIRNQQIGFVFQSFNLIPRTSALENAQLPLFYRGLSLKEQRAQAAAALGRVGLQGREHHYPLGCRDNSSVAMRGRWSRRLRCSLPMSRPATSIPSRAGKL
jgi:putative ABC transport system ATP-binding protein